jgi:glycerol-3-phosphate dehydrogenase (NAD(P)+)
MVMVAEGVFATRIVRDMARARGIDMPITEAVDRLLEGTADALSLVDEIMTREPKAEGY